MTRRIIALLSAAMMLFPLISCSGETGEEEPGTTPAAETTEPASPEVSEMLSEMEKRALLPDGLPEKTYDGRTFTFLVTGNTYTVDDYTGESVNDAKYDRNLTVENRFDMTFAENMQALDKNAFPVYVDSAVRSGDTEAFDAVSNNMVVNGAAALNGCFANWHEIPCVDFTQPWWPESNLDCLTINDRAYAVISDAALNTVGNTYCMFYDKVMAETYNLPDMYELVSSGGWTYDKLVELVSNIYTDVNGNGTADEGDYYGLASAQTSNVNTYLWAFDNPIYTRDRDGTFHFVYYTEKLPDIIRCVVRLFNEYEGVYSSTTSHHVGVEMFSRGQTLFANGTLSKAIALFGDLENEYGIIPYPKYDENQKNYYTMVDGGAPSIGISAVAADMEFAGIVMEALSAETYKQVLPIYLDQTLKTRYSSSPEDAAMVDLLLNCRVFDFGYVYDNWKGVAFYMQTLVMTNSTDIASYYASRKDAALAHYEKCFAMFEN